MANIKNNPESPKEPVVPASPIKIEDPKIPDIKNPVQEEPDTEDKEWK